MKPATLWALSLAATWVAWLLLADLRLALGMLAALHGAFLCWGIADLRLQFFGPALLRRSDARGRVALTFDDGPDPAITPEILAMLKAHKIAATFFVVGERAKAHPEIVRQAAADGHTIGCHDLTHAFFSNMRLARALARDIGCCRQAIAAIIGSEPALYRPPCGLTNPHTFNVLKKMGMHCCGWSRRGRDTGNRRLRGINKIAQLAAPGEVLLLHDVLPRPEHKAALLDALNRLLQSIEKSGLHAVTIDELFGIEPYAACHVSSELAKP